MSSTLSNSARKKSQHTIEYFSERRTATTMMTCLSLSRTESYTRLRDYRHAHRMSLTKWSEKSFLYCFLLEEAL